MEKQVKGIMAEDHDYLKIIEQPKIVGLLENRKSS